MPVERSSNAAIGLGPRPTRGVVARPGPYRGETGWYYGDALWRLRGFLDKLVGGVGLRRVGINPDTLRVGDPLDFWRVLTVEKNHRLVLLAEMKLPGEALLEFRLLRVADNVTELTAHSRFLPRGLGGLAYWYATYPLHQMVFSGLLEGLPMPPTSPCSAARNASPRPFPAG